MEELDKAAERAQFDAESFLLNTCLTSNDIHTGCANGEPHVRMMESVPDDDDAESMQFQIGIVENPLYSEAAEGSERQTYATLQKKEVDEDAVHSKTEAGNEYSINFDPPSADDKL